MSFANGLKRAGDAVEKFGAMAVELGRPKSELERAPPSQRDLLGIAADNICGGAAETLASLFVEMPGHAARIVGKGIGAAGRLAARFDL